MRRAPTRVELVSCCFMAQGKYPEIVAGKDPLAPELPAEFEPRVISFVMVATGVAEIIGACEPC